MIDVRQDGPNAFDVTVREGGNETHHHVTLDPADLKRLASGDNGRSVVAAAFRFLLDREPKESILPRFDLMVIARYFPEFEGQLPRYLDAE